MEIICIFCLLAYAFFARYLSRVLSLNSLSLINTFTYFWLVIVLMSILHLYGLYRISSYVYLLVLMGSGCFLIGYFLYGYFSRSKQMLQDVCSIEIVKDFTPLFYVVLTTAVVLVLTQVALLLPLILSSGMAEARHMWAEDESLRLSGTWDMLVSYFAKPFIKASLFLMIISLFQQGASKSKILLMSILGIVYFFSEGGRSFIMDMFFVLCYLFYVYHHSLSRHTLVVLKNFIIFVALMPILATLKRGYDDIFYGIYTYYCGSLTYLTKLIETKAYLFQDNLYGMASYQGLVKPVFGVLASMGMDKPDLLVSANNFILKVQELNLYIAPETKMNYFATCFGYSYRDGGVSGVLLGMIIYGMICSYIDIKESMNLGSTKWLALKGLFFSQIFFTMSYMPYSKYMNGMVLIFILLICNSKMSKKNIL